MKHIRELLVDLPFGSLMDALDSVHEVYARAELAMDSFRVSSGLSCPPACGTCCEGFIPDITGLEAAYLAAWMARHKSEQAMRLALEGFPDAERKGVSCPLYSDNPDAHCGVYEGRPLICRLFGFSATRAKDASTHFALCRSMTPRPGTDTRVWKDDAIAAEFAGMPPVMADLGAALAAIQPNEASERRLLTEALPDALRRIFFLSGFIMADRSDEPEPSPQAPLPVAG